MNANAELKKLNVIRCARCGQDHTAVPTKPFIGNPIVDEDGTVWDQWGRCPVTGDPILFRLYETPEDQRPVTKAD